MWSGVCTYSLCVSFDRVSASVNTILQKMCTILGLLKDLLLIERLSDSCILQLVKTSFTTFLVDNIQLLQLKAISLISGVHICTFCFSVSVCDFLMFMHVCIQINLLDSLILFTDILFIHTTSYLCNRWNTSATLEVTILKASTKILPPTWWRTKADSDDYCFADSVGAL